MSETSYEIGLKQDEKEKELQGAIKALFEVEQEFLLLGRQIIDLQGKKKDIEVAKLKASQNVKVISSELRILKNQFFAAKNSGI
jgi:hypothetical protein